MENHMKFRITVANVWWVEAETLRDAQGIAMREAGALAASHGWAVEARVTEAAGAFVGAALGRATGLADRYSGSARARGA